MQNFGHHLNRIQMIFCCISITKQSWVNGPLSGRIIVRCGNSYIFYVVTDIIWSDQNVFFGSKSLQCCNIIPEIGLRPLFFFWKSLSFMYICHELIRSSLYQNWIWNLSRKPHQTQLYDTVFVHYSHQVQNRHRPLLQQICLFIFVSTPWQ